MACNICDDSFGQDYCGQCSFRVCHECSVKQTEFKCPQCQKTYHKKYFLSGKIMSEGEGYYGSIKHRILVVEEKENIQLTHDDFQLDEISTKPENIVSYSDFEKKKKQLPELKYPRYILVGPCAILSEECCPQHGCWESKDLKKIKDIDILNYRNFEMIKKCDVFSLKINCDYDCFRSIAEWGIALNQKKIMILYFETPSNYETGCDEEEIKDKQTKIYSSMMKKKEFYMFAYDSLSSMNKLHYTQRDPILKNHPDIPFNDWCSYKSFLQTIIQGK
jgi:hypothetical protein